MKLKLTKDMKADFRHDRANFEGLLEFHADMNVAVAIPQARSELDTVMVAFFASKTPMSKSYAMCEALRVAGEEDWMVIVPRKGRDDLEIAREIAEVFSLVESAASDWESDADDLVGNHWTDYMSIWPGRSY